MTADLHGDVAGNAGALHVSDGATAQVVKMKPSEPRGATRAVPTLQVRAERLAYPVKNQIAAESAGLSAKPR
jgi:hypothetical protein